MPFDNFFEETDKRDFRFGVIVVAVGVLIVLAVFSYNYLTGAANEAFKPPPVSTADSQRYIRAAEVCDELPKPEQFERFNAVREPRFTDSSVEIFQAFRSERDFEEVLPTFLVWFDANGWKRVADYDFKPPVAKNRQLIFSKGNSIITIIHYHPNPNADAPPANYELGCNYEDYSHASSH